MQNITILFVVYRIKSSEEYIFAPFITVLLSTSTVYRSFPYWKTDFNYTDIYSNTIQTFHPQCNHNSFTFGYSVKKTDLLFY